MIHVIPHHIAKGAYIPWYEIINFNEDVIFHKFDDTHEIEKKLIGEPPYIDYLINKLDIISPHKGDFVMFDIDYLYDSKYNYDEFYEFINKLSIKYNDCKFIMFEDDSTFEYIDTERFTIFSNKFKKEDISSHYNLNCNYFRYRNKHQEFFKHANYIINVFKGNIRQKKTNLIVGVDKKERLQILKYFYKIGLDSDSWIGYSAFNSNYNDSEISDELLRFKKEKLPIIIDTPFEKSCEGNVNVEIPPLPLTMTSYVSCVLETSIIEGDVIHLSEKSWNPFVSQNIPLILGSSYLNEYLQDIGFWLAHELFDLKPKLNKSDIINQYMNNLNIINNMSYSQLHQFYSKNQIKISQNFRLLEKENNTFIYNSNLYK